MSNVGFSKINFFANRGTPVLLWKVSSRVERASAGKKERGGVWRMELFYEPKNAVVGDVIPFYDKG